MYLFGDEKWHKKPWNLFASKSEERWTQIQLVVPFFRDCERLSNCALDTASETLLMIAQQLKLGIAPEEAAISGQDTIEEIKEALLANRSECCKICAESAPFLTPGAERFGDFLSSWKRPERMTLLHACDWGMRLVSSDRRFFGPEIFLQEKSHLQRLESLFSGTCDITHFSQVQGRYGNHSGISVTNTDAYDTSLLISGIVRS